MKVYNRVVIDMATLETLEEDSFEYEGPVALCGGGSSTSVDKEYNKRIAEIAEAQQGQSEALFNFYKYGTFEAPSTRSAASGGQTGASGQSDNIKVIDKEGGVLEYWVGDRRFNDEDAARRYAAGQTGASGQSDNIQAHNFDGHVAYYVEDGDRWFNDEDAARRYAAERTSSAVQGGAAAAGSGTGPGGQVTLGDILARNPSMANLELAEVAANMRLIEGDTALAQEQTQMQRNLIPGMEQATQAELDYVAVTKPWETKTTIADAKRNLQTAASDINAKNAQNRFVTNTVQSGIEAANARNLYTTQTLPGKVDALQKLRSMALRNTEGEAARMAGAEVNQAFATQQRTLADDIRRTGAVAGSGRMAGLQADLNTDRTKAIAGARTAARKDARDSRYDQLARAVQLI